MAEITVTVETEIKPTESEEKVEAAVNNILANASMTINAAQEDRTIIAKSQGQDSLLKIRNLFRSDRIRDAARKALFHNMRGNTIKFCLNKQVASAGHISFSAETGESPLGPLYVTIETENPRELIEWLAEKTSIHEG